MQWKLNNLSFNVSKGVPFGTTPHSVTGIRQQGTNELMATPHGCNIRAEANQIPSCWAEIEVCPAHLHMHWISWVMCLCDFISPSFTLMKCPNVPFFTSVLNEQSKVLALNLLWSMTQVPRGHRRKWWMLKRGNWGEKCQLISNWRSSSLSASEWVCLSGSLIWIQHYKQLWALSVCFWGTGHRGRHVEGTDYIGAALI